MSDDEDNDYLSGGDNSSDDDTIVGGAKKKQLKVTIVPKKSMDYDDDDDEESESDHDDDDDDEDFVADDIDKKKIVGIGLEMEESDVDEYDDQDEDEEEDDDDDEKPKKKVVGKAPVSVLPQQNMIDSDDENESDEGNVDDEDEDYLQKFGVDVNKNYIHEFHPECISHNYDEIAKLSNVVRDENDIIVDPLHRTIPFLTKYERARVLGQRAKQIETGSKPLVKVPDNIIDGYLVAEMELEQKKIPFIIRRPLPHGGSEYWRLSDLQIIAF